MNLCKVEYYVIQHNIIWLLKYRNAEYTLYNFFDDYGWVNLYRGCMNM